MAATRKIKVFISYPSTSEKLAKELSELLSDDIIDVSYDKKLLTPGSAWAGVLDQAKDSTDCFIVLVTPDTESRKFQGSEIGEIIQIAKNSKKSKLLIPVIAGNAEIPPALNQIHALFIEKNVAEVVQEIRVAIYNFFKIQPQDLSRSEIPPLDLKKDYGQQVTPGYWLLKMNPRTWYVEYLVVGQKTFFNTYYFGEKRPEYALLLNNIKPGDKILCLAMENYQGIVCEMVVTSEINPSVTQGEGFDMVISELFNPNIPLSQFINLIPDIAPKLSKLGFPAQLFHPITNGIYTEIRGAVESETSYATTNYLSHFATEGNHRQTDDQLEFSNDIDSFATVIVQKSVKPPLAIGLFGNWGSGKSFFMEKLSCRIAELSRSEQPGFLKDIVQVKFNSWHYSDTNLWASLTMQIFEDLHEYASKKEYGSEAIKALYNKLDITSRQLEDTQKELATAENRQKQLEEEKQLLQKTIDAKKEALSIWNTRDLATIVFKDPFIQQDFEQIKSEFREEELVSNVEAINSEIQQVTGTWNKLVHSFKLLYRNSKGKWIWIWLLFALAAVIVFLVLGPLRQFIEDVVNGGIIVTTIVLGWLGNALYQLAPWFNRVDNLYKRLKSLKKTIESEKDKVRTKEHEEVDQLNKEIKKLSDEKAKLETKGNAIEQQKQKLAQELDEIGTGRAMSRFLQKKSGDDQYRQQLGIISWIRKDFKTLDDLFCKQRAVNNAAEQANPAVHIDRIVLYIDDLDRCNEDVVVKVLEAIHLLLALELFVVIVGVDPRWLNNALSEKYKNLFGKQDKPADAGNAIPLIKAATSYDYLEKIFQIPFALKPIGHKARKDLIHYLVKNELDSKKTPEIASAPQNDPALPQQVKPDIITPGTGTTLPPPPATEEIPAAQPDTEKQRLTFLEDEKNYMQLISPLFGETPRTINRFINIYRIIKAHHSLKVKGEYSKEDYQPVMFMLAIITGLPDFAEIFITSLQQASANKRFRDFIELPGLPDDLKNRVKPLMQEVENYLIKDFQVNVELVSRFSFRTLLR